MSEEDIIITQPPDENDNLLRKKFYEDIARQSERVDNLSAHLLSIELAIPGIYAGILKLVAGDGAVLGNTPTVQLTFGIWFIALILTLVSLAPKKYIVDTKILIQDPAKMDEGLGIEDFFSKSAQYKLRLAFASSLFFFLGILSAVFTIG